MPFEQLTPRPFTPNAVRIYSPIAPGVYGISNAREWIYVGAADNIQGALLGHLEDSGAPIMKRYPTGFTFEVCEGTHRPSRQQRLILEYKPVCNERSPRGA